MIKLFSLYWETFILFITGYCNSAINPMIYALFSKDFRFAFKRIICKCFCSGKSIFMSASRRGSDMSAIRMTSSSGQRTPSISPSHLAQSIGEDSELGCESEILRWRSYAPSISSSFASSSTAGGRPTINIHVNSVNNSNTINNNINMNVNMNQRNLDGLNDVGTSMKSKCANINNEIDLNHMKNNNAENNSTSGNARASSIYDICHPLVM